MYTHTHTLTALHDAAEDGVVSVERAAVPAVVAELVLALADPLLGAFPDGAHEVRVALAELPLLVHQARNVVTYHPCPQSPDVPAGEGRAEGHTMSPCHILNRHIVFTPKKHPQG